LTFDERRHIRASSAFQEIAFPVARHSSILDLRRSLANRDGIQDLALSRTPSRSHACVPKVVLAAQVLP
jgi:hypothetical protein